MRKQPVYPVNTAPRLQALYVCEVYNVSAVGEEQLILRKYYEKPGYAKSYRTQQDRHFKRLLANWGNAGHIHYRAPQWLVNGVPVVSQRYDVYAITPNGYEDIP